MPYTVESPLSAAAGAAGGYLAGQTEKKRRAQDLALQQQRDAQAQADTQARLDLARQQARATDAYRTSTLAEQQARTKLETDRQAKEDAAAADAARRQKLIDTFQGQGLHYPKNWTTMKPEQKIAYLQVRMNAAQRAGDKSTVSATETEINRVATEAAALAKENAPPKPTYADLHPRPREGRTPSARDTYFQEHGSDPPTYNDLHPKPGTKDPYSDEVGGLASPAFRGLPAAEQTRVRGLVAKHGMAATQDALTRIANGTPSKVFTKQQAAQVLKGLTATTNAYKSDASIDDDDDQ